MKTKEFAEFIKQDFDVVKDFTSDVKHDFDVTKDYTTSEALQGLASVFYCNVYYAQVLEEFRELVKVASDDELIDFFKKLDVFK